MTLFKNKQDFKTKFEFYTGSRFENLTLETFDSIINFIYWIIEYGKEIPFSEPNPDHLNCNGISSLVLLTGDKAFKFFIPDENYTSTSIARNSTEFIRAAYLLMIELKNALVIETILKTAAERFPKLVETTNEYSVSDHFVQIEKVFISFDENDNVQIGYIMERLYPIVDKKFVIQDMKKVFSCLINLGIEQKAWVIHGDIKMDNILTGCGGRIVLLDFGMSSAKIEMEDGEMMVWPGCFKKLDPSDCMHIDTMFLAFDLELPSMKNCTDPYVEVCKPYEGEFLIEKYLP